MGVKEVVHRTKHLGWGTDTHIYRSAGVPRGIFGAAADSRLTRAEAKPRQRRSGRMEGGADRYGDWRSGQGSDVARATRRRSPALG
jgi:hypothetical protein